MKLFCDKKSETCLEACLSSILLFYVVNTEKSLAIPQIVCDPQRTEAVLKCLVAKNRYVAVRTPSTV